MPRTCLRVPFAAKIDAVNYVVLDILGKEGFHEINDDGEVCWKKGTGLATAMQYLKIEYAGNELLIYGWLRAGVGKMAGSEMELEGIVGAIPKKKLRSRMELIARAVASLR